MMREWATVVSWQDGEALLNCDVKTSCQSCASRAGCGNSLLNKLGPKNAHLMKIRTEQPLVAGQKVELGIAERSLLGSALLVYMTPLAGLFIFAALFQLLFNSDLAAATGAVLGGVGGFLIARAVSVRMSTSSDYQPVILNVSLPPGDIRIEKV